MKRLLLPFFILTFALSGHAQKEKFGRGFYRITYYNVHDCKTEMQSFDSTVTVKKMDNLRSLLHRFGAKDRGLELEFPAFRIYDFTKKANTPKKLAYYGKQQIKEFEKTLEKLKNASVPQEFQPFKDELINNYTKRLKFEKIICDWYNNKNDKTLRKKVTEFYTDAYIQATLDKTLALENEMDKMCYTYLELYDIVFARIFGYDRIIHLQNKLLIDYKIEIVIDPCTKS